MRGFCEEEMNFEQLDSLNQDIFCKPLDMLRDIRKLIKGKHDFFSFLISKRNLVNQSKDINVKRM